jgi:hypothetical protein
MSRLYSRLNKTEKIHNLNFAKSEYFTTLQRQSENIFAAKLGGEGFERARIDSDWLRMALVS